MCNTFTLPGYYLNMWKVLLVRISFRANDGGPLCSRLGCDMRLTISPRKTTQVMEPNHVCLTSNSGKQQRKFVMSISWSPCFTEYTKGRISKIINPVWTKTKLHVLSPQANYTDRLSDRRLSAKLVPTLADRGCRVVSATIPPQFFISVF
jgi:hypothetical protein